MSSTGAGACVAAWPRIALRPPQSSQLDFAIEKGIGAREVRLILIESPVLSVSQPAPNDAMTDFSRVEAERPRYVVSHTTVQIPHHRRLMSRDRICGLLLIPRARMVARP